MTYVLVFQCNGFLKSCMIRGHALPAIGHTFWFSSDEMAKLMPDVTYEDWIVKAVTHTVSFPEEILDPGEDENQLPTELFPQVIVEPYFQRGS